MFRKLTLAIGLMFMYGHVHSAVMWDWDASTSTLFGAKNVDVGGLLYDVEFVDGTCNGRFNGCDDVSDFAFGTRDDAIVASQALLDQVFVDDAGAPALFDTVPYLTNGCESQWFIGATVAGAVDECWIATPTLDAFSLPSGTAIALNDILEIRDGTGGAAIDPGTFYAGDTFSEARITFAKWTPVSTVPAPATVWLFGTALIGLVGFSKRRKSV